MLSKIFKLTVKFFSVVFGTLILTATVFGVFYTLFLNEGIMRIIGPLMALGCGIGSYVILIYFANKSIENKNTSKNP